MKKFGTSLLLVACCTLGTQARAIHPGPEKNAAQQTQPSNTGESSAEPQQPAQTVTKPQEAVPVSPLRWVFEGFLNAVYGTEAPRETTTETPSVAPPVKSTTNTTPKPKTTPATR
ncbi:MAG: hypothetical protein SF053_13265 [Bacteroidia bacterium]|nr:hypothetical protein [Bacteroidia bacterium]